MAIVRLMASDYAAPANPNSAFTIIVPACRIAGREKGRPAGAALDECECGRTI